MAMVFTIAEAIKAWMMENNVRALTEHEKVVERKLQRDRERGVVDADQVPCSSCLRSIPRC